MNLLTRLIKRIDNFQRRHIIPSFIYAVIKKYNQDNGGYQCAIITYYGFLALFPLLMILTTVSDLLLKNNSVLRKKIINNTIHYFPIIGNQLQNSIHSSTETGIVLIISLLITFYGSRGVASTFSYSLNTLWYTPLFKQASFLKNTIRNFSIIVIGGISLLLGPIVIGYMTIMGSNIFIKIIIVLLNLLLLWLTIIILFKLAIAGHKRIHQVIIGAAVTAVSLEVLQVLGSVVMVHELKQLSSIYGTFSLVVGLLFWIYLQVKIILFAVEIDVIREYHLFPRSLSGSLTTADRMVFIKQTKANEQNLSDRIIVKFKRR